jgi:hypothetical protein
VKESKERVEAALHGMGYTLANQKVIINLSPSELKKTGPLYDLSMAIGVLLSLEELSVRCPETGGFVAGWEGTCSGRDASIRASLEETWDLENVHAV